MQLLRLLYCDNPKYGLRENNKVYVLGDSFNIGLDQKTFQDFVIDEVDLDHISFLPPCNPTKIIGVALNYPGVSKEKNIESEPLVFLKGLNALSIDKDKLNLSSFKNVWGECEIALVIKKKIKNISINEASKAILGFMPANDVTCDNFYKRDHHLARSKSADGFCTVGNYIDLDYQYHNKLIQGFQNNILIREGNTNDMIFSIPKIVSWISSWMTLYPGDIILTGAPSRVRKKLYLKSGDTYSVRLEGFENLNTTIK